MKRTLVLLHLFLVITLVTGFSQGQTDPNAVKGYITRLASPLDFDVNGMRVLSNSKTKFSSQVTQLRGGPEAAGDLYVGQSVSVYGKVNHRTRRIEATYISFHERAEHDVAGYAVIDRVLLPLKSSEILVRADGYPIRIRSAAKIKFKSPLTSLSDVAPNVWIAFHGSLKQDGTVLADSVVLYPNVISDREDKLLQKTDYDPSAVPDSSKPSSIKTLAFGADPKAIPPYHDAAMQARIERIGKSLIPEYQKALSGSDDTKITFQFQLVDGAGWKNAWALPSGVILVPRQIVEKMQNDSQLAAVLADAVSCVLEKQAYREQPSDRKKALTELVGVGEALGGPVGWANLALTTYSNYGSNIYGGNSPALRTDEEQRGRVALGLLHDAGYDISEAAKALLLVSAKDANHVGDTEMPKRAIYLYQIIGEVWHN